MNTSTETTPAPEIDALKPWLHAAYGSPSNVVSTYKNLVFDESAVARVAQIAGWLTGLTQCGQRDLAEKAAEDINSNFRYLDGYGGAAQGFTFADGQPVEWLPRYMIRLADDRTFGGFNVLWHTVVSEEQAATMEKDRLMRGRWGEVFETYRWNPSHSPVRHSAKFYYQFAFNGGLLYHGPGGGETFHVSLGDVRFWGIHT